MAFNDYTFVRTKMSGPVETVLEYDVYQPESIEWFLETHLGLGNKVSFRALNEGHTFSVSVTGGTGTPNQNLIISTFGDSLEECLKRVQFLIDLQPITAKNWLSIPDVIKQAEVRIAAMLAEYMKG